MSLSFVRQILPFTRPVLKKATAGTGIFRKQFITVLTLFFIIAGLISHIPAQSLSQNIFGVQPGVFSLFDFDSAVKPGRNLMATLVVDDDGACPGAAFTTIHAAVAAANPGDTIEVCPGTYVFNTQLQLNKSGLTLVGTGMTRPVIQIPGSTNHIISVTAANVTIDNFEIVKTDDTAGTHNMIFVNASNFTAQNNLIHGPSYLTQGATSRAFEVAGGLTGLLFHNNTIHSLRQPAYINGGTVGTISNNNVSGTRGWVIDGAKITFINNSFGPPANQGADIALLASCNPADYPNLPAISAANDNAYISAQFAGGVSGSSATYVDAGAAPGGLGTIDAPYQTIQQGVDGVYPGGTVNVAAGTYIEDVNVNKNGVSLLGAGASSTTISGAKGGSTSTVQVTANNVTVAGFTITREGNNVADWNGANGELNLAGISIINQSRTGLVIRDNIIKGNRNGIDINNSNGHTIRNNIIEDNRTGVIFRNQTDNITMVENFIINNWTVGVLFLNAGGAPPQQAHNGKFHNNFIGGNWYGQVVDRQVGDSVPTPGTTNLKDFRFNWWGTASPVVTTNDSAEPDYSSQIPVAYGGTATPPGGQPDIAGPASANIIYAPTLQSGLDTDIETVPGRGTFGFQGGTINVTVKPSSMNGWVFYNDENDTIDNGLGSFVGGPGAAPAGVGSAQISVTGTQRRNLATYQFGGTSLADITTLKFSTYNASAGNGGSATRSGYLHFNVDFNGTDTWQRRLVFIPSDNGTVIQDAWQEWDAINGGNALWRYSGPTWPVGVGGGGESGEMTKTWSQILSQYPGVRIRITDPFLGIRVGEPYDDGYTENIDLFKFGTVYATSHFDFEPERPTVTINQADSQTDPTSTSPIHFSVVFSEPVTGFDSSDVILGGTAGASNAVVTGSGTTYDVAVSGMTGSGTVTASIADGAAVSISNGVLSEASTSTDNTVTYFTCNNVAITPPTISVTTNTQFTVPITVDDTTGRNILSYDFSLSFDPAVVFPIGVETAGTLSSGWTVTTNTTSGIINVSGFNISPLSGSGTLLNLRFISIGGVTATSQLNFNSFMFNEGIPCANTTDGSVTVVSGSVSGTVTYANALTTTPVPNTTLSGAGSVPVSTTTDANGQYSLNGFGSGSYVVTPSKTDQVNGISNADAARIAQHTIGFAMLNSTQMIAADVTGNGQVTSLDAAYIAQYVVGIENPGSTGTWRFIPTSRSYPSVASDYTDQDYSAILMGEVTGNWSPVDGAQENLRSSVGERAPIQSEISPKSTVTVAAPETQYASHGANFSVSIRVSDTTGEGILGYQFHLIYDDDVIFPQAAPCDTTGTLSEGGTVFCNASTPGIIRVVMFGVFPLVGEGTLLKFNFNAVGSDWASSPLRFENFMFNEGIPQHETIDGQVVIVGPTAANVSLGGYVMSASGRAVSNATLTLTDGEGVVRMARSNSFGYYRFQDLPAGRDYVLTVSSKRYTFAPQVVNPTEPFTELNIIAEQ